MNRNKLKRNIHWTISSVKKVHALPHDARPFASNGILNKIGFESYFHKHDRVIRTS